jgi:hypothetical protein
MSCSSAVGIETGYELHGHGVGVRVPVGSNLFTSPHSPDRLWGSPNLLSNGCRGGAFLWGQRGRGVKLSTRLQLRKRGSIHSLRHTSLLYRFTPYWTNKQSCALLPPPGKQLVFALICTALWSRVLTRSRQRSLPWPISCQSCHFARVFINIFNYNHAVA